VPLLAATVSAIATLKSNETDFRGRAESYFLLGCNRG
jgi:hypothetical protein